MNGDRLDPPEHALDVLVGWAERRGMRLYPHQEEALLEIGSGAHVVVATPTGSGKSLIATGGHLMALTAGRRSVYTAPIKALVSEKFFALCELFGADRVGMLTGDAAVNAEAPIICCTAEVLANIALRQGRSADVGLVVMDEFHYYAEPDRGWAWQVPLLELTDTQFVLMSATLGDMSDLAADLTRRSARPTAIVTSAERPVTLTYTWSTTPLAETLTELVTTGQAPVYVVHFTQAAAVDHATSLLTGPDLSVAKAPLVERLAGFRFGSGFGKTLRRLVRAGIGVHHAGMLPRYRRLVEQLAQDGLLSVVCGTDTLGVGINVPIRTVLFTGLAKYDGHRQRVLRIREFQQIAGRAGRAGFDTIGHVVVQAPEHVIDNERALAKAGDDPKKRRRVHRKKPPEGSVVWTRETFERVVSGAPERLVSRMRVSNAMIINVLAREEDAFAVLRRLLTDNHETRARQLRLARRALRLGRSLLASGVVRRRETPDEFGRRFVLTVDLPDDFALNQPLAHFALAALDVLDPAAPTYPLDVVSVIESVLEAPRQILLAQQHAARGEAVAQMKAEGIEYDERLELLAEVTWPQPLAELLEATYEIYLRAHPWLGADGVDPKSVVREMVEQGMGFTDFVSRYQLSRSEGLVLRYLTDAYRTLRQTVPAAHRTPELTELVEWLGETVRQTDSSLLDEWEALTDSDPQPAEGGAPPPVALTGQVRAFTVMVRNAMFRRVSLAARDDVAGLAMLEAAAAALTEPPGEPVMTAEAWDAALEAYYAEHREIGAGPDARGPAYFQVTDAGRRWRVRQILDDPAGHHDWAIDAEVDLDASDRVGEAVVRGLALARLDG